MQKYIDKSMWEKSRTLAKSVKNRQSMEKELDNMDEELQQEMQQFSDTFRAITPTSNYDPAFAQLWGGGKAWGLAGKGKKSKYWTQKLAKELTGHKDGLRQQLKLLTKIYQQRKLETAKVKEQRQEALKDLKTSNTFMTQNSKILEK